MNYWENTTDLINHYNQIVDKINFGEADTTDDEDEFLTNNALYLAHALIKDYGDGGTSRDELLRCAKIIVTALEE